MDAIEEHVAGGLGVARLSRLAGNDLHPDRESETARLADDRKALPLLHALERLRPLPRRTLRDAVPAHHIDRDGGRDARRGMSAERRARDDVLLAPRPLLPADGAARP